MLFGGPGLAEGINACIVDIDATAGAAIQVGFCKDKLLFVQAYVSKAEEVHRAVAECVAHFGNIDYLVKQCRYPTLFQCYELYRRQMGSCDGYKFEILFSLH